MAAIREGRTDVVELLIKHNADVNARKEVRLLIHYIDRDIWRLLFVHAYKHVCVPLSLRYGHHNYAIHNTWIDQSFIDFNYHSNNEI